MLQTMECNDMEDRHCIEITYKFQTCWAHVNTRQRLQLKKSSDIQVVLEPFARQIDGCKKNVSNVNFYVCFNTLHTTYKCVHAWEGQAVYINI